MKMVITIIFALIFFDSNVLSQNNKTADVYLFNNSHFHLTNYIQEGITANRFLDLMGNKVGRSTLFGIPVQQQWSYQNSGKHAP